MMNQPTGPQELFLWTDTPPSARATFTLARARRSPSPPHRLTSPLETPPLVAHHRWQPTIAGPSPSAMLTTQARSHLPLFLISAISRARTRLTAVSATAAGHVPHRWPSDPTIGHHPPCSQEAKPPVILLTTSQHPRHGRRRPDPPAVLSSTTPPSPLPGHPIHCRLPPKPPAQPPASPSSPCSNPCRHAHPPCRCHGPAPLAPPPLHRKPDPPSPLLLYHSVALADAGQPPHDHLPPKPPEIHAHCCPSDPPLAPPLSTITAHLGRPFFTSSPWPPLLPPMAIFLQATMIQVPLTIAILLPPCHSRLYPWSRSIISSPMADPPSLASHAPITVPPFSILY